MASQELTTYQEARALAQALADQSGFDYGLEIFRLKGLPDRYHVFMLPRKDSRFGHETRCEVVSCTDLAMAQAGHGP